MLWHHQQPGFSFDSLHRLTCVVWPGESSGNFAFLTTKQLSPKVHDKAYVTYGFSDMLHSSESWGPNMGYDFQRHNTMCIIS